MEDKRFAIDLLSMYIGVEEYYTEDMDGNIFNHKEISVYSLQRELRSEHASRRVLYNLETADEIMLDQDNNVISYYSGDREIYGISSMHSLYDAIGELIKSIGFITEMENGQETLDYFVTLYNHMNNMRDEGNPAFLDASCLPDLIKMIANIYTLSYGNPLDNKSRIRCINDFRNGR